MYFSTKFRWTIYLGSKTQDINDFKNVINTNLVENYLNKINLNNKDFVYIDAEMIKWSSS
ncbi:hypothetical protein NWQ34_02900 [Mycoplasmopsis felis]|uniref:hypothetical protein n=1 Tax=Mycoplasmopsis felis TaxID=33923 RepID=UPI0021E0B11F|nr:hypothetical protein [Mycoplasmopsis felis]MCU9938599.1 hypothetical protein [Mycoplasmopsis felis]